MPNLGFNYHINFSTIFSSIKPIAMKLIYCLMILLWPFVSSGQTVRPLNIGDAVPDLTITNVYNYPASKIHLSDQKGKLVILDFMSTGCLSCIEALLHFDSLQKKYGKRLLIIIVSYEPSKNIERFLTKSPIGKQVKLPVVSNDSILSWLFPHVYISHEVWIKDGKVKAITGAEYVSSANVQQILDNVPVKWPVKRDIAEFDYSKHIVHLNEEAIPLSSYPAAAYYSAFTNNIIDVPHRFIRTTDTTTQSTCISLINLPVIDLYRYSYGEGSLPLSNIILNVKDTSRYIFNSDKEYRAEWTIKKTYCYEIKSPSDLSQKLVQQKMVSDLDFYLGIRSSWETKAVPCLVLIKKQGSADNARLPAFYNSHTSLQEHSRTITPSYIVYQLNQNFLGVPALDESGLNSDKALDTTILNFSDLNVLNRQMEKYGLELTIATRFHKMLVLTEKSPQSNLKF
jgi:thiol-disulfide isomerase/thioredoxin